MLRSAFSDDTLTATDNMLRASRPMHSEGVDDLSGPVSDWLMVGSSQCGCVLHGSFTSSVERPPSTRPERDGWP